jgi:hypothetical protein
MNAEAFPGGPLSAIFAKRTFIDQNRATIERFNRFYHWAGSLFDRHFASNATLFADNPTVENLTARDGFLIMDWSKISVISKLPLSIALYSCRG